MAQKTVEGRSAGKRSRPSGDVYRQIDTSEIQHLAPEIQMNRLRHRFGLSPAHAAVVASLAFPGVEGRA